MHKLKVVKRGLKNGDSVTYTGGIVRKWKKGDVCCGRVIDVHPVNGPHIIFYHDSPVAKSLEGNK